MSTSTDRRDFLASLAATGAGLSLGAFPMSQAAARRTTCPLYKISVAEYSLHRLIASGGLDPRDFGPFCQQHFDVDAVEYWMGPFNDKAQDRPYMREMHSKSVDARVQGLLIMVDIPDGKGNLGHPDAARRTEAVEIHYQWVEAAKRMGCHSIRVNARSEGSREKQAKLAADGLRRLSQFAAPSCINVLVENHGGLSSDGAWLAGVIDQVGMRNCGTLPDFGNFRVQGDQWYDRYQGVAELMPFAKAVSAKSHEFDDAGNEVRTDYRRMMKIVVDAGYRSYVGIEWEGGHPESEIEGVLLTKRLLERVRDELAAETA
ncbi:MAG: TIM barrel protein [Planctomycetes bacterium]|nr:TIM barrel protein [Planctomycetota bacterium]